MKPRLTLRQKRHEKVAAGAAFLFSARAAHNTATGRRKNSIFQCRKRITLEKYSSRS